MKRLKSTKSLIAFFALIQLGFFPLLSFAQSEVYSGVFLAKETSILNAENAKVSGTVSRPGQSLNFSFSAGAWHPGGSTTYSYDSEGRLANRVNFNLAGQNVARQYYVYDSGTFILEYGTDIWRNNSWDPGHGYRYLETFDNNGNLIELIYQERFKVGGAAAWINKGKHIVTFNSQNKQTNTDYFTWNNDSTRWYPQGREFNFIYNSANVITSYMGEIFTNGSWQNLKRYSNLTWEKKNKILSGLTTETLVNGSWTYTSSYAKTYSPTGGKIETYQTFTNGNWLNTNRTYFDLDTLGNDLGWGTDQWQNGAWTIFQHHKHLLTYNANQDVTERISQLRQYISPNYTNETKWVYSNFQYFTIAGVKNGIPQEIAANAFPNPVDKMLTIELSEKATSLTAQLSDVTGKLILSRKFLASETKQLQLETLKPGIYLLHLQTEKGKTVRKIVKN